MRFPGGIVKFCVRGRDSEGIGSLEELGCELEGFGIGDLGFQEEGTELGRPGI